MCWGKEREKHDKDCTWKNPKCRWRKPTCCCDAYHYPHRPGSGLCGSPERRDALMYGTALRAPAIGQEGMNERKWWASRAAVVEELMLAEGNAIITEAMGVRAAEMLRGHAPATPTVPALPLGALRAWYAARRAVVDLLLPLLIQRGGAVIPGYVMEHIRELLSGARPAPRLRDARALATSKVADALTYSVKAPEANKDEVVPF